MTAVIYSDSWGELPGTSTPPQEFRRSRTRKLLSRNALDRRAILKGAFVAMSAASLASIDGLFNLASADEEANPPTWYRCEDYVGSSVDNGYWTVCNPYANDVDGDGVDIGPAYCNNINYHRNDQVLLGYDDHGHKVWRNYERRPYSCKDKNAWNWHISDNPNPPNPSDKRCSDGKYRTETEAHAVPGWHYSVCKHLF